MSCDGLKSDNTTDKSLAFTAVPENNCIHVCLRYILIFGAQLGLQPCDSIQSKGEIKFCD